MCQEDVNNGALFTTSEERHQTLEGWNSLRNLHNSVVKTPVVGRFAGVTTQEMRPRSMSKTEVLGIVGRKGPQTLRNASLLNKAAFTAAVGKDKRLFNRLATHSYLPLPSKYEIVSVIPLEGISIRDLMRIFAPRLSIKTVANFVERVFLISAMDPVSRKLQPVWTLKQAKALPEGAYRDAMRRATRSCISSRTPVNLKRSAFKHEQMESYFFNQVREVRVTKPRGRKEKIWYYMSDEADRNILRRLEPLIEEAEEKRREEIQKIAEQYTAQEKREAVQNKRKRSDSVVCAANALLDTATEEA